MRPFSFILGPERHCLVENNMMVVKTQKGFMQLFSKYAVVGYCPGSSSLLILCHCPLHCCRDLCCDTEPLTDEQLQLLYPRHLNYCQPSPTTPSASESVCQKGQEYKVTTTFKIKLLICTVIKNWQGKVGDCQFSVNLDAEGSHWLQMHHH